MPDARRKTVAETPPETPPESTLRPVWVWAFVVTALFSMAAVLWNRDAILPWLLTAAVAAAPVVLIWYLERRSDLPPHVGLAFGFVFLALGGGAIACSLAWDTGPLAVALPIIGVVHALAGLVLALSYAPAFATCDPDECATDQEFNLLRFHRHLVLLGALLVLFGLLNCIVLSGLVRAAVLDTGVAEGHAFHVNIARLLLLSVGNAVLGALFFVANSCRETKKKLEEGDTSITFVDARLWGGLWFRVGEAIVFTLVVFLLLHVIRGTESDPGSATVAGLDWLPVIALLLGMFVKPSERVIKGIRDRIFSAVEVLIPAGAARDHSELGNGELGDGGGGNGDGGAGGGAEELPETTTGRRQTRRRKKAGGGGR